MTVDSPKSARMKLLGSNLILGLLVICLSVFTAMANYTTYIVSGKGSEYQAEGDRLLADSNTEYISASQFIIVDYTMYDNYYTNVNKDADVANYYKSLFSDSLQASVDRNKPFDDQYYTEMYKDAKSNFDEAFKKFDQANAEGERESGYQFATLIAAVGLAFAAYASLLEQANRLRNIFSLMALIMLILGVGQFIINSAR